VEINYEALTISFFHQPEAPGTDCEGSAVHCFVLLVYSDNIYI